MTIFWKLFILLHFPFVVLNDSDGYCESDKASCLKSGSVISRLQREDEFVQNIAISEKEYVPCLTNNCSCYFETLSADLLPYKEGITLKMIDQVRNKGTTYVVLKNRLYKSKECVFPARCSGVEHFLKELLPKLPDFELVLNTRDWPQISKHFGERGPVFSFSKTPNYLDIHFPAWSFWEGGPAIKSYPRGLGRWDLMRERLAKENQKHSWEKKIGKGFFRGSRTSEDRDTLILLSRAQPELVDAQYTKNQAWKSPADTLHSEPAAEVSLEEHCKYKYLFNLRGVAASFRLKHLFLCGSLVLHFGEEWTEFFYDGLKPWVHYVPVAAEATQEDIIALMSFFREHDDLARKIAERGRDFITHHLRMKDVRCYWRHLLRRYSKLISYPVSLNPTLEEIR